MLRQYLERRQQRKENTRTVDRVTASTDQLNEAPIVHKETRVFNYGLRSPTMPLNAMTHESGGNLRAASLLPFHKDRGGIKVDTSSNINPDWYVNICKHLEGSPVVVSDNGSTYWKRVPIERPVKDPEPFLPIKKSEYNNALKNTKVNIGIGYSNTQVSVDIPISEWASAVRTVTQSTKDLKSTFITERGYGWYNSAIHQSLYGDRSNDGSGEDTDHRGIFNRVAKLVLCNNWMQDPKLATGLYILLVDKNIRDPANSTGTLTFYVWAKLPDETSSKMLDKKYLYINKYEPPSEELPRPQMCLVPYVCVKDVPQWLMVNIDEGEDAQKKLRTAHVRAGTAERRGNICVGMEVESDSESWESIEQLSLEVEPSPREFRGKFVTNQQKKPCWIRGLGLDGNSRNSYGEKDFCKQSKVLLATTPHIMALQTVLKNRAVIHPPHLLRFGRASWLGIPQTNIDATYAHMVSLGHLEHIKEQNNEFASAIMRWDPKAIVRPITPDADSDDKPGDWALAINSEWTAWF